MDDQEIKHLFKSENLCETELSSVFFFFQKIDENIKLLMVTFATFLLVIC
jgi:hypothetical protein